MMFFYHFTMVECTYILRVLNEIASHKYLIQMSFQTLHFHISCELQLINH